MVKKKKNLNNLDIYLSRRKKIKKYTFQNYPPCHKKLPVKGHLLISYISFKILLQKEKVENDRTKLEIPF